MSIIKVISRKFPKSYVTNIFSFIDYQNKLAISIRKQPGCISSTSYWLNLDNYESQEVVPICHISKWNSIEDWNIWCKSKDKYIIDNCYKVNLKKEKTDILVERDVTEIPEKYNNF